MNVCSKTQNLILWNARGEKTLMPCRLLEERWKWSDRVSWWEKEVLAEDDDDEAKSDEVTKKIPFVHDWTIDDAICDVTEIGGIRRLKDCDPKITLQRAQHYCPNSKPLRTVFTSHHHTFNSMGTELFIENAQNRQQNNLGGRRKTVHCVLGRNFLLFVLAVRTLLLLQHVSVILLSRML